jgi:hypothetical protein
MEQLPLAGDLHPMRAAVEERVAEVFFQRLDLAAHRARRHAQVLGGELEAAAPGRFAEHEDGIEWRSGGHGRE